MSSGFSPVATRIRQIIERCGQMHFLHVNDGSDIDSPIDGISRDHAVAITELQAAGIVDVYFEPASVSGSPGATVVQRKS